MATYFPDDSDQFAIDETSYEAQNRYHSLSMGQGGPNPISSQNAPMIYALREKLFDIYITRQNQKKEEEDYLRFCLQESGADLEMVNQFEGSLSDRAMASLIEGTEGDRKLKDLRSNLKNK